jgi:type I restriction enzyme S subunit
MVQRLDAAAAAIDARTAAAKSIDEELRAILATAFARIVANAPCRSMVEVAPLVRRPVIIDFDAVYPELGVRSFRKGTFHKPPLGGIDVGAKKLFRILPDDLLFNIVFAWEGAVAVARDEDEGRVGSRRFLSCVPKPDLATSTFIRYWFLSPDGLLALNRIAGRGGAK